MRAIHARRRLAVFLGIAAALALIAAGAAYALTASSFKYSSAKTSYVRVHALAFAPGASGLSYFNGADSGLTAPGGGCFVAGVDLPVGSLVKSVTFYYKSGAGSNLTGQLWRMQLSTAVAPFIAAVGPSNDAGTPTSVTATVAAANQLVTRGRAYGVGVCPGSDGNFYGARIKYTYTSAGS
jgi:hypothetical protein